MIKQLLTVADDKWTILFYYCVSVKDFDSVVETSISLGCPLNEATRAADIVSKQLNTGLTVSDLDKKISFVCVSNATSRPQFVNTVIHELKHVQSHICEYYGVDESSEQAAYLIGYLALRVYKTLSKFI